MEVFKDNFIQLKKYDLDDNADIFKSILKEREDSIDSNRFFLEYFPQEKFLEYDFNNLDSIKKFRSVCMSSNNPLTLMGGCNMNFDRPQDDIRYAGIKLSDPYGEIYGCFDIRDGVITYSPIFPHFYEERDLVKFAKDRYFTTTTFDEIMAQQIENASSFYVHIGNYRSIKDIIKNGNYILEKVSKSEMIEFASNPKEGVKVYEKAKY